MCCEPIPNVNDVIENYPGKSPTKLELNGPFNAKAQANDVVRVPFTIPPIS